MDLKADFEPGRIENSARFFYTEIYFVKHLN